MPTVAQQNNAAQGSDVFPLFFQMAGRTVLVVGAGKVATRRVQSLCRSSCNITVVAKDGFAEPLTTLAAQQPNITLVHAPFAQSQLEGCSIALAATNDAAVNRAVHAACKAHGVLVNVCDAPTLCDFYFPALFETETLIGGIVSKQGNAHAAVKQAAEQIREVL